MTKTYLLAGLNIADGDHDHLPPALGEDNNRVWQAGVVVQRDEWGHGDPNGGE